MEKLKDLADRRGAKVIDRGNGHYQIRGSLLVNYYPESRKRSAYIAGTTGKRVHVTPAEAVDMAFEAPCNPARKARRRSNYKGLKRKLWNSGKRRCRWCLIQLTMEPHKPNSATLEHIIPLARGGLDNINNMDLACEKCNQDRGSDMPELEKPQKEKRPGTCK